MDLVIRNGIIATSEGIVEGDIGVSDGLVCALGGGIDAGFREFDARGHYVLPGGIDVHTHLDIGGGGNLRSADSFRTGTIAAICGGTTTVIDFCQQEHGQSLAQALDGWHRRAEGRAVADYGFHIIVADPTPDVIAELAELPRRGVTSFKIFLAYRGQQMVDDRALIAALEQARLHGAIVMVHAENGDAADFLVDRFLKAGLTAPEHHAASRPPRIEAEATNRAIALAEIVGAPIYIVHVSCRESLEEIVRGRARGVTVHAETCTHYLYTTAEDLKRPNFEGAKFVFSPPARQTADQSALWSALGDGDLEVISSDHGGWSFGTHKTLGRGDFSKIPNGVPGVEERMVMAWQGVDKGRFDVRRFVELTSTAPARLFGLFPRKGSIAVGSDADFVVWDPKRPGVIRQANLHHATDFSVYEGREVQGFARAVFLRGMLMAENGNFVGPDGCGEYLHRSRYAQTSEWPVKGDVAWNRADMG